MNYVFFFFNDTATTEIYTLSLHDALPICRRGGGGDTEVAAQLRQHRGRDTAPERPEKPTGVQPGPSQDRKSTRLNSSHANISYAVFCLKKKKHNGSEQGSYAAQIVITRHQ